jgi:hypothetical protein
VKNSTVYALVLVVIVVAAGVTAVLAPDVAALAIPIYVGAAASVISLLQASTAATKVAEVAVEVRNREVTIDHVSEMVGKTGEMVDKIHTLVNSNMGGVLRLSMMQAKRIAELDPVETNQEAAKEAERLYQEHMESQKVVDDAHQLR